MYCCFEGPNHFGFEVAVILGWSSDLDIEEGVCFLVLESLPFDIISVFLILLHLT